MSHLATLTTNGPIATLVMIRAEARNSMSLDMLEAMHTHVDALKDSECSVLVITGAGKAFCAGMDLKAVLIELSGDETLGGQLLKSLADLTIKLRQLPMVTVAKVNGAAVGGGCGLSCVCDVSISHADAKLGFPEVDLGLCPAVIAPWVVAKMGAGRARAAMLKGGIMSGAEAAAVGLVDHLADDRDGLDALTDEIVERLASGGREALATTKGLLNKIDGVVEAGMVLEGAKLSAQVLGTAEAQASLSARMKPGK
jgi:enoyl-CoA hydratase/carnithine racemase